MSRRENLLKRLDTIGADPIVLRLRELLAQEDAKVIGDRLNKVSVSEALRLWRTRLKNTDITGLHLDGAEPLIRRLEGLAPQRKLEHVAVIGHHQGINLFFQSAHPSEFVGAIVYDLAPAARPFDR